MNSISPKRIMKLAILIMLLLSLAFSLCACSNKLMGTSRISSAVPIP